MLACESIHLKENLEENPNPIRPLNYHKWTEHVLPTENLKLQKMMDDLKDYATAHEMVVNKSKTIVMLFNKARSMTYYLAIGGCRRDTIAWYYDPE